MQIKLLGMELQNFKGIENVVVTFNGKNSNVYGDNRTGKTTLFDAFIWSLFDKNSQGDKSFGIKTASKVNQGVDHMVEVLLDVDGSELKLKKVYSEKWTRKRGSEEAELTGHTTDYWIDEVPSNKTEYDAKVKSLMDESLFKAITDVMYFTGLKWQDQRKMLLDIVGDISDEEIIDSNEKLKGLKAALEKGHSIDQYMKIVKEKKKQINDEIQKIPTRIDEADKSKPTAPELPVGELIALSETLKGQITQATSEVGKVDLTLEKFKETTRLVMEVDTALQKEVDSITRKFNLDKMNLESKNKEDFSKLESIVRLKKQNIDELKQSIALKEKRKADILASHKHLKEEQFDTESTVCPTCKRDFEAEQVNELKENFKNNLMQRDKELREKFAAVKLELEGLTAKINFIEAEIIEAQNNVDNFKPIAIAAVTLNTETEKVVELRTKLASLKADQEAFASGEREKEDTSIVDGISSQLEEVNQDIQKWASINKTDARIEELSTELKKLSSDYAKYENAEFLTEEFIKIKVGMLEGKINSLFTMVQFKLFNQQINGGIAECCEAMVNGVVYSDINSEAKINAGLDIINRLTAHYGVSAPIWIDNAESVTKYIDTNSQLIRLYVVQGVNPLRVEGV
jgi:DNA repair exonuclease SbcCD ATPase subunit